MDYGLWIMDFMKEEKNQFFNFFNFSIKKPENEIFEKNILCA